MKIVLVTPEIPFNTGNIGRTCVALGMELILIKPYGFSLDEKSVKRSGTGYWNEVVLSEYDSWQEFMDQRNPPRDHMYLFEEFGEKSVFEPTYQEECYLVFGCESKGRPPELTESLKDRLFNLPMKNPVVKSLNLSSVAAVVAYQALRTQLGG
ncbi:MAG: tRNA (cytidine(34)-2'-O)-methyltransferase [Halocynthiibacter sp.]